MAFKMRSGNKVSFKNMGSSSPANQKKNDPSSGDQSQFQDQPEETIISADIPNEQTGALTTNKEVDTTTNKEVGDKKTESHFDFTDALKGFLESGGGKEGLLKGIGAGISKKSPNEKLAIQEARDIRKAKKDKNKKAIETASGITETEKKKKPKGEGWIKKAGEWVRGTVKKGAKMIEDKKAENQAEFEGTQKTTNTLNYVDPTVVEDSGESENIGGEDLLKQKSGEV